MAILLTIAEEPTYNGLYFQNAVPYIRMVKTDANPTVQFDLKIGLNLILSEIYHFDADNFIRIRNLSEIVKNYFTSTALQLEFKYTLT